MPSYTFTPPMNPDANLEIDNKPEIKVHKFGDGYALRTPRGANYNPRTISLTWSSLTPDQADTIEAFFAARNGHESFWYTPPGNDAIACIVTAWRRQRPASGRHIISAAFVEVFD